VQVTAETERNALPMALLAAVLALLVGVVVVFLRRRYLSTAKG